MAARSEKRECVWSNNHYACVSTWGVLRLLSQLNALFDDAKDLRMNELTFWNNASSPEMRRIEARGLASQIDKTFVLMLGARYEAGFNPTSAIEAMTSALLLAEKTVCEFAEAVDEIYAFLQEPKG